MASPFYMWDSTRHPQPEDVFEAEEYVGEWSGSYADMNPRYVVLGKMIGQFIARADMQDILDDELIDFFSGYEAEMQAHRFELITFDHIHYEFPSQFYDQLIHIARLLKLAIYDSYRGVYIPADFDFSQIDSLLQREHAASVPGNGSLLHLSRKQFIKRLTDWMAEKHYAGEAFKLDVIDGDLVQFSRENETVKQELAYGVRKDEEDGFQLSYGGVSMDLLLKSLQASCNEIELTGRPDKNYTFSVQMKYYYTNENLNIFSDFYLYIQSEKDLKLFFRDMVDFFNKTYDFLSDFAQLNQYVNYNPLISAQLDFQGYILIRLVLAKYAKDPHLESLIEKLTPIALKLYKEKWPAMMQRLRQLEVV